ncbi:GIY-YIG nuclease family protein [bacterium]|nr:GIY-YIG nuclease family protein [bacterium]
MAWKPGTYYMYIMSSSSGATYIGMTNNLMRRVQEHRDEGEDGYCGKWFIDKLVYFETYSSPMEAITREKQIKKWVRKKKLALISESNPKWEDITHLL